MKKIIYFDNAATTRVHPEVFNSMTPYFCDEYANPAGALFPAIFQKPLIDFPNSLQTHFVLQKWKLLSNLI